MRTPNTPIVSLSGPRPPRVNLPCCHWTQGISSCKADVLETSYKFPHSGCSVFDWSNSGQQPSQALRINPLTQGQPWSDQMLYKNQRLSGTSRKGHIPPRYPRAIPTKCLPRLTPLGTTGLTPCRVHCPMHSSKVGLIPHVAVVLLPRCPLWGQHTHQLTGQHKNREIIKKYYILTTEWNSRASAMAGLPCKCQFGLNFTVGAVTRSIELPWGWNKHSLAPWGNHSHENSIPKRHFTRWGSELNQQGLPPINPLNLN